MGTTKAHVYQQTLGFTQYQNNLVTDLWLYYKVYLAPKQSRNRPMITREYTPVPKQSRNRPKAYLLVNKDNKNIQETKFKSVTTDIRFLTVRMSGRVFVV